MENHKERVNFLFTNISCFLSRFKLFSFTIKATGYAILILFQVNNVFYIYIEIRLNLQVIFVFPKPDRKKTKTTRKKNFLFTTVPYILKSCKAFSLPIMAIG